MRDTSQKPKKPLKKEMRVDQVRRTKLIQRQPNRPRRAVSSGRKDKT